MKRRTSGGIETTALGVTACLRQLVDDAGHKEWVAAGALEQKRRNLGQLHPSIH
jgi:hypothetical protein